MISRRGVSRAVKHLLLHSSLAQVIGLLGSLFAGTIPQGSQNVAVGREAHLRRMNTDGVIDRIVVTEGATVFDASIAQVAWTQARSDAIPSGHVELFVLISQAIPLRLSCRIDPLLFLDTETS